MDSESGVMDSNDVTDPMDNWKILESGGIDDDLSPVLLVFCVKGWIDNLDGADESVAINFIWEGGIRDNTVEVHWIGRGQGGFVEFNVLVL